MLKEAYVKGRYSKRYRIGEDQLQWLGEQAQELARVVQAVCREHIVELERIVAETAGDDERALAGA